MLTVAYILFQMGLVFTLASLVIFPMLSNDAGGSANSGRDNLSERERVILEKLNTTSCPMVTSSSSHSDSAGPSSNTFSDERKEKQLPLILVLIDALRPDMLLDNQRFPKFHSALSDGSCRRKFFFFIPVATAPTVTLPKLKVMLTGKDASYLDVLKNFAATNLADDNVITMARRDLGKKKVHFFGDDTWVKMLQKERRIGGTSSPDEPLESITPFEAFEGVSSFDVTDYTEVDDNVTRRLREELLEEEGRSTRKEERFDMLILHYLGLDHIGHVQGPHSPEMVRKQAEMDAILSDHLMRYLNVIQRGTLMVVSDHGMAAGGGHGGSTPLEKETTLSIIQFDAVCNNNVEHNNDEDTDSDRGSDDSDEKEEGRDPFPRIEDIQRLQQVDVANILSFLLQRTRFDNVAAGGDIRAGEMSCGTGNTRSPSFPKFFLPTSSIGLVPSKLLFSGISNDVCELCFVARVLAEQLNRLVKAAPSMDPSILGILEKLLSDGEGESGIGQKHQLEVNSGASTRNRRRAVLEQIDRVLGIIQDAILSGASSGSETRSSSSSSWARDKKQDSESSFSPVAVILALVVVEVVVSQLYWSNTIVAPYAGLLQARDLVVCSVVLGIHALTFYSSSYAEEEHLTCYFMLCSSLFIFLFTSGHLRSAASSQRRMRTLTVTAAWTLLLHRIAFGYCYSGTKWKDDDFTVVVTLEDVVSWVVYRVSCAVQWISSFYDVHGGSMVCSTPISFSSSHTLYSLVWHGGVWGAVLPALCLATTASKIFDGRKASPEVSSTTGGRNTWGFFLFFSLIVACCPMNKFPLLIVLCWASTFLIQRVLPSVSPLLRTRDDGTDHRVAIGAHTGTHSGSALLLTALYSMETFYYSFGRSINLSDVRFEHLATTFMPVANYPWVKQVIQYVLGSTADAVLALGPFVLCWHQLGRVIFLGLLWWYCGGGRRGDHSRDFFDTVLSLATFKSVCSLCAACLIATQQRGHLFYWSVFLPKVVYAFVDAVFMLVVLSFFFLCRGKQK